MDISVETKDSLTIIRISGRLDSMTSATLENWADEHIAPPSEDLILDFSSLEYISSAGLRVILNMSKTLRECSLNFSICSAQDHVKEVFEISGFDTIIPMFDKMEDCLP